MSGQPEPSESEKEGPRRRPAPTEAEVRSALLRFAQVVQRLDDEDSLLRHLPFLMGRLGDIRRMLFDFEVRVTERLLPIEDPSERESRRIVREARDTEREIGEDWGTGWTSPSDDDRADDDGADGRDDDGADEEGRASA